MDLREIGWGSMNWIHLAQDRDLIIQPDYILPCSNSAMKGNNGTNRIPWYCCPNRHRTSLMFHYWNQAFRIVGFLGCSPNVNSSWYKEQCEGWLIWPYHMFPLVWYASFMVMTPLFTHLSITFGN
jgi:hypothetical protein